MLQIGKSEMAVPRRASARPGPVVKRRINDLVAAEAPGGVGQSDVADFAAPAFDERHGERVGRGRREFAAQVAIGGRGKLFAEVFARALDFQRAHAGAGEDIAAGPHGHRGLGKAVPARRMIVTHVAHQTAGARRRADQSNFGGLRGKTVPTFSKRARTDAASQNHATACSVSASAVFRRSSNCAARSGSRS